MKTKLSDLFLSTPENIENIKKYLRQNCVTFFSWKLFEIKISRSGKLVFDYNFDTKNADKYLEPELKFLAFLKENNINYRYVKLIPDELPFYFWNKKTKQSAKKFKAQVKKYFQKIEPKTEVIGISDFLVEADFKDLYARIFNEVYDNIDKLIPQNKIKVELEKRSTYYTKQPLSKKESEELAKKAFALFAAETTILFELQSQKKLSNLVMLAGIRSTDTYKYEFFKYPKNRPILPKLFVI